MAWLLVGSIPGVLVGSNLSIKVPERSLRSVFGIVLVLSGIKLVGVPEANYVICGMLVALAVLLVVWILRQQRVRRVEAQEAT
jgi:Flp pilus assembly protein TadB